MESADRQLIERAVGGDERAFGLLVDRHSRFVALTIRSVIPQISQEELEDAAQDIFLAAWQAIPRFRMDAAFTTWLHRIATRFCWRLAKKRRRRARTFFSVDREESGADRFVGVSRSDDPVLQQEQRGLIDRALEELPEEFRLVLLLRLVEEMPVEQVAGILEVSEGTVKSRLARGRAKMRDLLAAEGLVRND